VDKICTKRQTGGAGNNLVYPSYPNAVIWAPNVPVVGQNEFAEGFKKYLIEDGKRPKTIESYVGDVGGFLGYIRENGTDFAGDLKRFQITSYKNHLVERGYEMATINKKINSLQSFNHWLVDMGLTEEIVVDLRKDRVKVASGSEKQVEVYPEKQLEKLLFYMGGEKVSARDRA